MATRDEIELVRDRTDLVDLIGTYVALQPRGREHVGLCPFHDDSRPSFAVVTHKGAGFYKCHACGAAGDCFRFVKDHLGKEFVDALEWLAQRAGVELTQQGHSDEEAHRRRSRREWLRKAFDGAQARFIAVLEDQTLGHDARNVIDERGYTPDIVATFGIGAAADGWQDLADHFSSLDMPDKVLIAAGLLKQREGKDHTYDAFRHRLMFPIFDDTGQPIAFGGRVLGHDEEPKYLNSCEHDLFNKSRTLYGMHLARREIMNTRRAIVAEGYTDVITLHQYGFTNAVGTLGTALTDDHARLLSRVCDEVILLFDGDEAGRRAADRAIPIIARHKIDLRICVLDQGQDPDDLLRSDGGPERFTAAMSTAREAFDYLLMRLEDDLSEATGVSGRQRRIETFIAGLVNSGLDRADTLRRAMLTTRLGEIAGVAPSIIESLLQRGRTTTGNNEPPAAETFEAFDAHADQSTASRRAEHELLGTIIHSGQARHLTDAMIELMQDPPARRIAMAIRTAGSKRDELSVPHVLDEIEECDRSFVSELYFAGGNLLIASGHDADEAVTQAFAALNRCHRTDDTTRRLDAWNAASSRDPQDAAALIEHLKQAGPRVTAVPRATGQ